MLISKMLGCFQYAWVIVMLILDISCGENSVSTIPSTNLFATDYSNLIVRARFAITDVTTVCQWSYYNIKTAYFAVVVPSIICIPLSNSNEIITCADDGTYITSNLTLLQPLSAGSLDVSVVCDNIPLLTLQTITVQDCPSIISSYITVEATSYIFNAQGTFKCSNKGELFYSNGATPSSSDTTCLPSATWSGQDNLQCWSAPTFVTLVGNLTVVEGNDLTLACDYVDTTPIGSSSIFYIGDGTYTILKNLPFTLHSLDRTYNNTAVSCQALTPFTEIPEYSNRGISSIHNLIILGKCNISLIPRLSVEVCLANPGQAGSTIVEGETISVTNCRFYQCIPPLSVTCTASGWEGGPPCIPITGVGYNNEN